MMPGMPPRAKLPRPTVCTTAGQGPEKGSRAGAQRAQPRLNDEAQLARTGLVCAGDVREGDAGAAVLARLPLALRKLHRLDGVVRHLLARPAMVWGQRSGMCHVVGGPYVERNQASARDDCKARDVQHHKAMNSKQGAAHIHSLLHGLLLVMQGGGGLKHAGAFSQEGMKTPLENATGCKKRT